MKKIAEKTRFSVIVRSGKGSSTMANYDTLAQAIAAASEQAIYYALVCGYTDVTVDPVCEFCAACYGDGNVSKGMRRVRCRDCNGRAAQQVVDGWSFRLPSDVRERQHQITNMIGVVPI